jgi:hypothetical protein
MGILAELLLQGPLRQKALRDQQALLGQQTQMARADEFRAEQTGISDRTAALQPLLRQMPTTAAGALGPLLASPDAGARQQGQALLQEYLGRQSPETQARLQGQGLSNQATQLGMDQAGQAFPLIQQSRRLGIQQQGQNLAMGGLQLSQLRQQMSQQAALPTQAQQDTMDFMAENGLAEIPKGMVVQRRIAQGPNGQAVQFRDLAPLPGTTQYEAAYSGVQKLEESATLTNEFLDLLSQVGTEYRGADALKLTQLRDRIIGVYGKALIDLGTLQPGDLQRLEKSLPDPTALGSQLNPWSAENIGQVYEQILGQMEAQLQQGRKVHWYVPSRPVLPGEQ